MSSPASAPDAGAGTLFVVATPIGNMGDVSERARATLANARAIFCEDTRRTGRLLQALAITPERLVALHAHNERARVDDVLELLATGASVCLVSDAGTPLVSDPGERLVAAVIEARYPVVAVPGASAVLTALVASGLSTGRFRFEGFLPRRGHERSERIAALVASDEPSVIFEAPGRVRATLSELRDACGPGRQVAVCRELTKMHEEIWRGVLADAPEAPAATTERGEYVLVLSAGPVATTAQIDLDAALGRLAAAGLGRKSAVAALEVLAGVAHRRAYQAALEHPGFEEGRTAP